MKSGAQMCGMANVSLPKCQVLRQLRSVKCIHPMLQPHASIIHSNANLNKRIEFYAVRMLKTSFRLIGYLSGHVPIIAMKSHRQTKAIHSIQFDRICRCKIDI